MEVASIIYLFAFPYLDVIYSYNINIGAGPSYGSSLFVYNKEETMGSRGYPHCVLARTNRDKDGKLNWFCKI